MRWSVKRWLKRIVIALGVFAPCIWIPTPIVSGQTKFGATIADVAAAECGIDFNHTDGQSGKRYMVETVIGSLALFDYDNDGLIDIYFVDGAALPGSNLDYVPSNRLYRNLGNWRFVDVTKESGLGDRGYGMGVVVGDYDQDGDADVFVSNFGHNAFYVNQGDGTFLEQSKTCGIWGPMRVGAGNSFFDMDNDGDLDLYGASYVHFQFDEHKVRIINGYEFHTGPNDYRPAADFLYRNDGDGKFTDVSESSGITKQIAPGMGVLAADFDDDNDIDLFVANDQQPNFLLTNDGTGRFQFDELLAGVAFDRTGKANGNMGVEYADLDGDLQLDLITTTYQEEMPVYYRRNQPGLFTDATNLARLDTTLTAHVTWGVGAVDFDNDGDRDLFFACGHFLDNIRFIDDRTSVKVANYLLVNDGKGRFRNASKEAGSALQVIESSRGAGFDDLDNDGDVDFVIVNVNAAPSLGRTDSNTGNDRLSLRLIGTTGNRDAVGSTVWVTTVSGKKQVQATIAGRGYESHYGSRLYFGSGDDKMATIEVKWPSGLVETFARHGDSMVLIEGQSSP
ncbi:MAG: CRTAC1 family protein [Planctomycetota bacterium]|nr:CRTAC1 family protein [Planctomycetota bacterium]